MRRRRRYLKRVTIANRIVLLLFANRMHRDSYVVPIDVSQDGMSKILGIRQNHISRAMGRLEEKDLIVSRSSHVSGKGRRVKVYFLTVKGERRARDIISDLEKRLIEVRDPQGSLEDWSLSRATGFVSRKLGKDISYLDMIEDYLDGRKLDLSFVSEESERVLIGVPIVDEFFGRKEELKELLGAIEGDIRVISVVSMAGQGKTTLLSKAVRELSDRNIVWISSKEYHDPTGLLRGIARLLPGKGPLNDYLMSQEKADALHSIRILIQELDHNNGVLVMDDVERLDGRMRDFLEDIMENMTLRGGPGKLVVSGRERIGKGRDELTRMMELEGMDRSSSMEMLDSIGVDPLRKENIFEISRGHPLAMKLYSSGDYHQLSDYRNSIEAFVDREILEKMGRDQREALDYLSVFRFPVDENALKAAGIPKTRLSKLFERVLIRRYPDATFDLHDLIRDHVRGSLDEEELKRYSSQAARYYSNGVKDLELAEYIHFLNLSGDTKGTVKVLEEWGEYLVSKGFFEVSEIARNTRTSSASDRYSLELVLYESALMENRFEEARLHLDRAAGLCERRDSEKWKRRFTYVLDRYAELSSLEGLDQEVIDNYRRSLSVCRAAGDQLGIARVYNNMGATFFERGDLKRAESNYRKAERILEESDKEGALPYLYINLAELLRAKNQKKRCIEHLRRAISIASDGDMARVEATARKNLGEVLLDSGEGETGSNELIRASKDLLRLGDISEATTCFSQALPVMIDEGDIKKALDISKMILSEQGFTERLGILSGDGPNEKRKRSFLFLRMVREVIKDTRAVPKEDISKYLGWCANRLSPERFYQCVRDTVRSLEWVENPLFWDHFYSSALDSSGIYADLHPRVLLLISWAKRKTRGSKERRALSRRALRLSKRIGFEPGRKVSLRVMRGKP